MRQRNYCLDLLAAQIPGDGAVPRPRSALGVIPESAGSRVCASPLGLEFFIEPRNTPRQRPV
jgi:hypothetical protein